MKDKQKLRLNSNLGHQFDLGDEDMKEFRILEREGDEFRIMMNGKLMQARLLEQDHHSRCYKFWIEGDILEFRIETPLDLMVSEMGMKKTTDLALDEIHSPMPGLVLDILVKPGAFVQEGQALLILEAMKMENIIKSPGNVQVKDIHVKIGDSVEKTALLISLS